jgi:hypothetical protein
MYDKDSMLEFKRRKFEETYSKLDKAETLKELLFLQKMQNDNLVLIRKNTGKLVWMVVIITIMIFPLVMTIITARY